MSLEMDIISIHAPAKGATRVSPGFMIDQVISIHAPAKGATDGSLAVCPYLAISIHAPAKGATACDIGSRATGANFNPRSREGSDVILV